MRTIFLCGSDYKTPRALHGALKMLLNLPEYYGMNPDALNDCLGETGEAVCLWVGDPGEGETARALETVIRVIEDNGGSAVRL